MSTFELPASKVEFQDDVPCFHTPDGRFFAVKKVYGGREVTAGLREGGNTVNMYPGDLQKILLDTEHTTILLFDDICKAPLAQIPARHIAHDQDAYGPYHFVYVEPHNHNGEQAGKIILNFSRRSSTSRYWRSGVAPIMDLNLWPQGEYNFTKSVEDGRLKLFLVLSPFT